MRRTKNHGRRRRVHTRPQVDVAAHRNLAQPGDSAVRPKSGRIVFRIIKTYSAETVSETAESFVKL